MGDKKKENTLKMADMGWEKRLHVLGVVLKNQGSIAAGKEGTCEDHS